MSIVDQTLVDAFFNTGLEEDVEIETISGFKIIKAHFYDKYQTAKYFEKDIESSAPMIECRSIDVESIKNKGTVIARGIEF
ncbi:MAG TPA: hypothetical protein PK665_14600, partial [Ignavibacteriaceae bacterium]|nr:hypothetical protein [Ignavibacteriaceae bacterium]